MLFGNTASLLNSLVMSCLFVLLVRTVIGMLCFTHVINTEILWHFVKAARVSRMCNIKIYRTNTKRTEAALKWANKHKTEIKRNSSNKFPPKITTAATIAKPETKWHSWKTIISIPFPSSLTFEVFVFFMFDKSERVPWCRWKDIFVPSKSKTKVNTSKPTYFWWFCACV